MKVRGRVIKYFCDICGEQIKHPIVLKQTRTFELKSYTWRFDDHDLQICSDCYAEIVKFIENMKKKESEG